MDSIIQEYFDASEWFYRATIGCLEAGEALPTDAETPVAIAFRVAMTALRHGVACPTWAANAVSRAWEQFEAFETESITDAFGIPSHTRRSAKRSKLLCAAIAGRVHQLREEGVPLTDGHNTDGALTIVGREFHLSPKTVEKRVEHWKKLCRATGSDPWADPPFADAAAMIANAFAEGFSTRDEDADARASAEPDPKI
jgi:hypothetical protein